MGSQVLATLCYFLIHGDVDLLLSFMSIEIL